MSDWQKTLFPEPFFRPAPTRVPAPPITAMGLLTQSTLAFLQHAPFLLGVSVLVLALTTVGSCACYVPGLIIGTISGWALAAWSLGTVDGHARLRDGQVAVRRPLHAAIGSIWFGVTGTIPAFALAVPVLGSMIIAIPLWTQPVLAVSLYAIGWLAGLVCHGVAKARVGPARFLSVEHDVNPIQASAEIMRATREAWLPLALAYAAVTLSLVLAAPVALGLYEASASFAEGSAMQRITLAVGVGVITVLVMVWYGVLTTLDAVAYRALGYPIALRADDA